MLCQKCKEKQATVHFVKVINGTKTEMHLCEKCAPQQDIPSIDNFDITVSDILNSFFGESIAIPSIKCDSCGMTFDLFSQTGKLGCSNCYDIFGEQLRSPLKRIHGSDRHVGKIPKKTENKVDKLSKLKKELEDAIAKENFENAAVLRDEIKRLEGGDSK